jgi:uncharacterized membrane protein YcaP (DUF421 family)
LAISIIRTLILYAVMVASMRLMGKRQLGELEPAELVVAVLISDLAANPLQDLGTPLLYGLAPVLTLLFCEITLSAIILKSRRIRRVIAGSPGVIIDNGRLDRAEMKKCRYTVDELMEHLRKHGVTDIATVKYAVLEPDGTLSVVSYAGESPITPNQLGLSVTESEIPRVVISDGEIIDTELTSVGYDRKWLSAKLRENGIRRAEDVFLMTADRSGGVYLATKQPSGSGGAGKNNAANIGTGKSSRRGSQKSNQSGSQK